MSGFPTCHTFLTWFPGRHMLHGGPESTSEISLADELVNKAIETRSWVPGRVSRFLTLTTSDDGSDDWTWQEPDHLHLDLSDVPAGTTDPPPDASAESLLQACDSALQQLANIASPAVSCEQVRAALSQATRIKASHAASGGGHGKCCRFTRLTDFRNRVRTPRTGRG